MTMPSPAPELDASQRSALFVMSTHDAEPRLQRALDRLEMPSVEPAGSCMIVVTVGSGPISLRATARRVRAQVVAATRIEAVWVGVGGTLQSSGGLRESQREARDAVAIGRRVFERPTVVYFEDFLLHAALTADPRLRDRVAAVLEPLASYDRRSKGVLLPSVKALLDADLSTTEAANRLGVHRHTLMYRIERAERILGRSVRRSPDRTLIEAALLTRRIHPAGR